MRRLQARLASLEKKIVIPSPNAAMEEALQRALVRLTCEELRQLIEAAEMQEEGREGELTEEHHAAIRRQDELVAEEQALASGRR
jgi:hypothetical protein